MHRDPSKFRARFKAYKEGKMPYKNGLPMYADGQLPEDEGRQQASIPGPVTVLGNLVRSVVHPKQTAERIMRQSAEGVRSAEDILGGVLLNKSGSYTGHEGGSINNRDLVSLYLYGNENGFQRINPADNIGHSYDNEIIASGRDPKDIRTYYGQFPVPNYFILPKYAEEQVRALLNSGIDVTKSFNEESIKDNTDDVARYLATLSQKNGQPVVSYSDMWDFIPDQYNNEYSRDLLDRIVVYAADKAGTPFILRQNVPITFSDDDYSWQGKPNEDDFRNQILLRAGVMPEVTVYPEPRVLTPEQIKRRNAQKEAAVQQELKDLGMTENDLPGNKWGKLPEYRDGRIHIKPANRGKFNATKKRTGKTTEELTHSKNPLTRKRDIFAQNARKWNHK